MNEFLILLQTQPYNDILSSIMVIVVLWAVRWSILRAVESRTDNAETIYNWRKTSTNILVATGVISILAIWILREGDSLATYLGLVSAGIAISLTDPITNLVAWFFIIISRPLEAGDRVEIGEHAGEVIDIRFFEFTLLEIGKWVDAEQSTGRVLHIPNRTVFKQPIANYSQGFKLIWNEIPVDVTFESDWQLAKKILLEIANEHGLYLSEKARREIKQAAKRYKINYANVTPTVYTKVTPNGVRLTLRYLCEVRQRRGSEQAVWEEVLLRVAEQEDIDFAYVTQRIYYVPAEGNTLHPAPHTETELRSGRNVNS